MKKIIKITDTSTSQDALENIESMTDDELNAIQAKITNEKKLRKEKEIQARHVMVRTKLNKLIENKEVLLSLLEHGRTSCSDDNPCNGYSYGKEKWRCNKCMLIEILNDEHGSDFDVTFDITITPVEY